MVDWLLKLIPGSGYARIALILAACAASAWAGHQVGVSRTAGEVVRLNDALRSVSELVATERAQRAEADRDATLAAAEAARQHARAESRRAAAHQAERDRLAQRLEALSRESARTPVTRCVLPADEQRLLDAEYAAFAPSGPEPAAARAVHDPVPADAAAGSPRGDQP